MSKSALVSVVALGLVLSSGSTFAQGVPGKYRPAIKKALKWVASRQHRDGHWDSNNQYPVTVTSMCGLALLMEGSTSREGKYSKNIRDAIDWMLRRAMPNGMLGNPNIPGERGRYMYGHGFALLFLSCAYGEENNPERRAKMEGVLTRAAKFSHLAQTSRGGWGYVSARDGSDFDEGSVTITQVQALRAARNAGIKVPTKAIKMAVKYLEASTNSAGGVVYSLASGGAGGSGRPALTAAAISCGFSAGEYNSPLVKKWFKFCRERVKGLGGGSRMGHDEYTNYYFSQALYMLGDKGWAKMFPKDKASDSLSWSKYRKENFPRMISGQRADGSFTGSYVGPEFTTAVYLSILQLDNATLPIYQR